MHTWKKREKKLIEYHKTHRAEKKRKDFDRRRYAIEGAFEALSIIGDPRAIPVLQKLPIYDYVLTVGDETVVNGKDPLFKKAKETIERIQSGL